MNTQADVSASRGRAGQRFSRVLGVYPQKQSGLFMQRIKIPGGRINWPQWRRVAELATTYAAISRKLNQHDPAAAVIEDALCQPGLPTAQRAELHFSMGKLLDDLHDYDCAFEHFRQANDYLPYNYDVEVHKNKISDSW